MIIWLSFGLMVILAIGVLFYALYYESYRLKKKQKRYVEVYKKQLKDLEEDLRIGLINEDYFSDAENELQRNIISSLKEEALYYEIEQKKHNFKEARIKNIVAGFVIFLIIGTGLFFYTYTGSPNIGSDIFSERVQTEEGNKKSNEFINKVIISLKNNLNDNPHDLDRWLVLGKAYMRIEEYSMAIGALREAAIISNFDSSVMSMVGEAIILDNNGEVGIVAEEIFLDILQKNPSHITARYYIALAQAQKGNTKKALDSWMELAADTPADAEWRSAIISAIERAASELEIVIPNVPYAK